MASWPAQCFAGKMCIKMTVPISAYALKLEINAGLRWFELAAAEAKLQSAKQRCAEIENGNGEVKDDEDDKEENEDKDKAKQKGSDYSDYSDYSENEADA
eukprot:s250_g17.t1